MLRLASDADVHGDIIRGVRRRLPEIDLVRALDALPEGTPDAQVLAWAAAENRVLVTNDRNTMLGIAYERVAAENLAPGLIVTTAAFYDLAATALPALSSPRRHERPEEEELRSRRRRSRRRSVYLA